MLHCRAGPRSLQGLRSFLPSPRIRARLVHSGPTSTSYISFYRYTQIRDPAAFRDELMTDWAPRGILGRIYVASEGINAQMTLPQSAASSFVPSIVQRFSLPYHPIVEPVVPGEAPFKALHIRLRPQIVADRLRVPLDMSDTGEAVTPAEWHSILAQRRSAKQATDAAPHSSSAPLLIDCRNLYEAELGKFDDATEVRVHRFSETFTLLDEMANGSKAKEALIYCTGGIRCEKVGAYLKQQHGFNVKRLQGGINAYLEYVKDTNKESAFKGANFVFDHRTAVPVTEPIGKCHICKDASAMSVGNCKCCGVLTMHCPTCASKMKDRCSDLCASLPEQARLPSQGFPWRKAFSLP